MITYSVDDKHDNLDVTLVRLHHATYREEIVKPNQLFTGKDNSLHKLSMTLLLDVSANICVQLRKVRCTPSPLYRGQ